MTAHLPKFGAPPVVETVLSAQFDRLASFSNAHGGWFWKNYLPKEWTKVQSAPRLDDQFERFGEEILWKAIQGGIRIVSGAESERLQILRSDSERMIQIQDSRFIYNWRKQQQGYPSYNKVLTEFKDNFDCFNRFVREAPLSPLQLNQWEVTYVNHIEKGSLWSEIADWHALFPGLSMPAQTIDGIRSEDFHGEWRHILEGERGRLYVAMNRGKVNIESGLDGPEVIRLQLTARGPVDAAKGLEMLAGFELGHSAIVRYFTAITSALAHKVWQRRN